MNQQTIRSQRLGEQYIKLEHPSGLTMLLCPMEGFSTAYAMFSTQYGSVDTVFRSKNSGELIEVPEGIAHYLEHKLFESEDGDAFARFAKTGASANAFTSFDKTSYLFASADQFRESIEVLLDFVTHPYFTKETVEKEQGIIGQEIRMYDDDPGWKVMFNLLGCLYEKNPVKIDIAGTVESIAKINADLLYQCYNTFYNLRNMVLAVAGNFKIEEVVEAADRVLQTAPPFEVEQYTVPEPQAVVSRRIEQHLPVATPLFDIGFKSPNQGNQKNFINMLLDEMLIDIIVGETTGLYHELYEEGLINNGIAGETMNGKDYLCTMFSGESKDPDKVYRRICEEITRLHKEGIDRQLFERTKKANYGRYLGMFSKPESVSSILTNTYFAGMTMYEMLELIAAVSKDQLERRLREDFNPENSALSIVRK